jgi:hypothetical protein
MLFDNEGETEGYFFDNEGETDGYFLTPRLKQIVTLKLYFLTPRLKDYKS